MRSREATTALATSAALGLSILAPMTAGAQPAALDQVPAGADLVILVPNLQGLSGEIAELRQTLNLPMPEMDDALTMFKQSTGMNAGVDDAGSLVLVLPDLAEALEADREPETIMLVPVSDYDAFVKGFGGTAEGTSEVTMPDGQPGFSKKLGDYAVMGQTQASVDAYEAGNAGAAVATKVGALGQRYLDTADAVMYLDMEAVGPALKPAVQESIANMTAMMEMGAGGMDPAAMANAKAMWQLYGAAAETFINDSNGLLVALDLGGEGVGLTYAVSYKEGSTLAQVFPGAQADTGSLLGTLPNKPFLFSAAFDATAIDLSRLYSGVLAAMPDDPNNPVRQMSEKWLPLMEKLEGGAMAFYAPEMAMMGNFLNTVTVLQVADAPAYVQGIKEYVQGINGFELPAGPAVPGADGDAAAPGNAAPTISYSTSYTDNVLQLEGQKVDQFQVTTNFPPELLAQMGPAAGFAQMFANYSGYVTAEEGKVVMTTVLDPQLVTTTLQQLDAGGGIGAAGPIPQIREEALPPAPVAQMYVGIDGIAQTANTFLQMFGAAPLNVPADLPPVASGLSIEDHSMAYRVYFPTEAIKFVVESGMNLQQQFGGMGGPGAPGAPNRGPGGPPPF